LVKPSFSEIERSAPQRQSRCFGLQKPFGSGTFQVQNQRSALRVKLQGKRLSCPTQRAADTATPWARRGGWSGEVASLAVVVGRRRRAADAIVRPVVVKAEVVVGRGEAGPGGLQAQAAARQSRGAKRPADSRAGRRAG